MRVKSIARLLAAPLGFIAFAGLTFQGDRFTIDFPEGWTAPEKSADGVYTSFGPEKKVNCNAHTALIAELDGKTYAEIAELFPSMDRDGWADLLDVKPADIIVTESEKIQAGEATLHVATFTLAVAGVVKRPTMVRYAAVISPGKVNMSGCYSTPADFSTYRTAFDQTVKSLRPR